jgi:hypothetical protein
MQVKHKWLQLQKLPRGNLGGPINEWMNECRILNSNFIGGDQYLHYWCSAYIFFEFQLYQYTVQKMKLSWYKDNHLTELSEKYITGWLRRVIQSKFHMKTLLHSFQRSCFIKPQDTCCFSWLQCPWQQFQPHVHTLIQISDTCNLLSESMDAVSCLLVSQ